MEEKLRVILADDEPMICVVVQSCIHWQELGLEHVGTAYSGQELIDMIETEKPDIVVTDIRMPGLTGLDAIERIGQQRTECHFIVLTGYQQFEYAHRALKYGVHDYILKPVDEDVLNASLNQLTKVIRAERKINPEMVDSLVREHARDRESINNLFLEKVIHEPQILKQGEENLARTYGLKLSDTDMFRTVCVKFDIENCSDVSGSFMKMKYMVKDIICQMCKEVYREIFCMEKYDEFLFLFLMDKEKDTAFLDICEKCFLGVQNIMAGYAGYVATFGISGNALYLAELPRIIEEAYQAGKYRLSIGYNQAIFYDKISIPLWRWGKEERAAIALNFEKIYEMLDDSLFRMEVNKIFFEAGMKANPEEMIDLSHEITELYYAYLQTVDNCAENDTWINETRREITNSSSIFQLKESVLHAVVPAMQKLKNAKDSRKKRPVREAQDYIARHYREPLTLADVAEKVNLNPVYFSNIFKKETGSNFTDYVHEQRLEIAKKRLRSGSDSVKIIAEEVGYEDVKYFSKIFKKHVGIKPTDYRKIYG